MYTLEISINRHPLNGIKWNESSQAPMLLTKELDAIFRGFFIVHYDGINVTTKHGADSFFISFLFWFTQLMDTASDSWEQALEICD